MEQMLERGSGGLWAYCRGTALVQGSRCEWQGMVLRRRVPAGAAAAASGALREAVRRSRAAGWA
eukprot:6188730-Pleurochrysis_carterae.AAC.1